MRRLPCFVILALMVSGAALLAAEAGVEPYAKMVAAEPGLVAQWRLDGDAKDAKGGFHGEIRGGAPAFDKGPNGGQAIVLGKGSFVTIGDAPALDLAETTVELWFKPTFEPGKPGYNPCLIAMRKTSAATRFSVHIMQDYSHIAVWNGHQVILAEPGGAPLKRGEWYYVAVTAKGGEMQIYIDGLPCAPPGGGTFTFAAKGLPLQIGSSSPEGVEVFDGLIAQMAIYSRVLSAADVERHMDAMGAKKRPSREEMIAKAEAERQARNKAADELIGKLFTEDALFARGETQVYRGEHLAAISLPVGGVGTGTIEIDGKAARPVWQIFNNMTLVSVPDSFFAVRAKAEDGKPILRALQTAPIGPFPAMKALSFRGEYPFGWFDFEDPDLPVQVSLETFNPLIPLDLKNSAIPCAIYRVTVENKGTKPVQATVIATQQNAVGYLGQGAIQGRAFKGYGGNVNRIVKEDKAVFLEMTADKPKDSPAFGTLALAALDGNTIGSVAWDGPSLARDLDEGGMHPGPAKSEPSPPGETVDGALAVPFELEPGAKRTTTFILAWHFPNGGHGSGRWGGKGNMYSNWWPDALAVARDVAARFDDLSAKTRLFHDSFYASNLPYWMLDRIVSQLVNIRSQTCFWTQAGYFGGWEGCNPGGGCCEGNCNHVWHYAQGHARLLPELGKIMREQELKFMSPQGGIPHRQPGAHPAFDGQCGGILASYREHLMSPDGAWLAKQWPSVKKAMDFTISNWDKDEDGVLAGPQWNTLDGNLGGSTSWLGTLYLAALAASEKMAALQGDADSAARYRRIRESGSKKQDESLFNGKYYIQIPDAQPHEDYVEGCHIDQLLGQWWSHQLDLGWLYPPKNARTALRTLFASNFQKHFYGIRQLPRRFVADDDPGLQMITWPAGAKRPARQMQYASEVMSGFEYSAAAEMVYAGLLREGFSVIRAAAIRYDGRRRTGTAAWGWSGNPFCDDECGKFYARTMSIWSVLLACQGTIYDGPAGLIGFRPRWQPADHVSFFTAAEGYGLFTQRRADRQQTERLEVRSGKLTLRSLLFELPEGARDPKVALDLGGRAIPATATLAGTDLRITLGEPITITPGAALGLTISW